MFPFDSDSLNFFFILQMEKYGGRPAQLVLYYHGFMGAEVTLSTQQVCNCNLTLFPCRPPPGCWLSSVLLAMDYPQTTDRPVSSQIIDNTH